MPAHPTKTVPAPKLSNTAQVVSQPQRLPADILFVFCHLQLIYGTSQAAWRRAIGPALQRKASRRTPRPSPPLNVCKYSRVFFRTPDTRKNQLRYANLEISCRCVLAFLSSFLQLELVRETIAYITHLENILRPSSAAEEEAMTEEQVRVSLALDIPNRP